MEVRTLCFCAFVSYCVIAETYASTPETVSKGCVTIITTKKPHTRKITYLGKGYVTQRKPNCKGNKGCTVKKYGPKTLTKLETHFIIENRTACCAGWKLINSSGENVLECAPLCQPFCPADAECVAPDTCKCKPPLVPDADPLTKCIQLKCSEGYVKNEENNVCEPVCEKCRNGNCTKPDVCACNNGFYNPDNDTSTCVPMCPESCQPGYCETPHVCTCNSGYEFVNDTCSPVCGDCSNGICEAPNSCTCNDGYQRQNGTCVPRCENCLNGICVSPGKCECFEGYRENNDTCLPVCEKTCIHGECVAPNVCECLPGYEWDEQDQHFCRAICSRGCGLGGRCVAPEQCYCFPGFDNNSETGLCQPVCSQPCSNGTCTAPELCTCLDGFELVSKYSCQPICSPPCIDAECVSPRVCECFEGFRSLYNESCEPKCESCENGKCSSPGVCRCNEGYENIRGKCEPVCSTACQNGRCVRPEVCECLTGYRFDNHSRLCERVCEKGCVRGICNEEGKCDCHIGYYGEDCSIFRPQCSSCGGKCTEGERTCFCQNKTECDFNSLETIDTIPPEGISAEWTKSSLSLASVCGAAGLLMLVAAVVIMRRCRRKKLTPNPSREFPSVIAPAAPNSLFSHELEPMKSGESDRDSETNYLERERDRDSECDALECEQQRDSLVQRDSFTKNSRNFSYVEHEV